MLLNAALTMEIGCDVTIEALEYDSPVASRARQERSYRWKRAISRRIDKQRIKIPKFQRNFLADYSSRRASRPLSLKVSRRTFKRIFGNSVRARGSITFIIQKIRDSQRRSRGNQLVIIVIGCEK